MKRIFLFLLCLTLASIALAQGTRGPMYYNKALGKWVYTLNTDSVDVRMQERMILGDSAPFGAAAASGTYSIAINPLYRNLYYRVANSTVNWYGIINLPRQFLFTDSLKYWFGNRSLANDTCIRFISSRTGPGTRVCSLFVYHYGDLLTDTLFRVAFPNTVGVQDTTYYTFETCCKDSNRMWPVKQVNGYYQPFLLYQLKVYTSSASTYYDIFNFRILTDWRNH